MLSSAVVTPQELQQLADALQAQDITRCAQNGSLPWSPSLPPGSDARHGAGHQQRLRLRHQQGDENLPQLRERATALIDRYLDAQQDILETFVDRGQLRRLSQPTLTKKGKKGRRIPGLKLDHPRQLALMQALVRFAHLAAGGTFTTRELHPHVAQALGWSPAQFKLTSPRYELSKLRAKGLVEKVPHSQRYRLLPEGYRLCVVYLKLFEKIYAPLTTGLLKPFRADARLPRDRITQLDGLYLAIT